MRSRHTLQYSDAELPEMRARLKLLLVDDDAQVRRSISSLLRQHVAEVVTASRGEEAIELLTRFKPDAIIAEVSLRGMNVDELIRMVQQDFGRVPFIIHTSTPSLAPRSGYRGVTIKKPARESTFLTALDRLLFS